MRVDSLLQEAKASLTHVAENPSLEAEILLSHILQVPRSHLRAWPEKSVTQTQYEELLKYIERRAANEPIAYLTGLREFWSLELKVTKDILVPRPETEGIVEAALQLNNKEQALKIADLGTGSGAIALALASECKNWEVYATDICDKALQVAKENAKHLGIDNISFYQGNWCEALPRHDFDVIVSNPPYLSLDDWEAYGEKLAFEPNHALVSGSDGLVAIREIVKHVDSYLKKSGLLIIEHGFSQALEIQEIFKKAGFSQIQTIKDVEARDRVTLGRYI
jgi:release factor glutamine methyltransferase